MRENSSPIFSKTYDFLVWLLDHTEKFPKSERFRMAKRLEDTLFSIHANLVQALHTETQRQSLREADRELDKLRFYLRLSQERKLTSKGQYHHAAGMVMEIGKLLGGWMKTLPEEAD